MAILELFRALRGSSNSAETNDFYPIDGVLNGNGPDSHNFNFTLEMVGFFTHDASADHTFSLCWQGGLSKSLPPVAETSLVHYDNGDTCKALLNGRFDFDIAPVREEYQRLTGEWTGTLVLQIGDLRIDYVF